MATLHDSAALIEDDWVIWIESVELDAHDEPAESLHSCTVLNAYSAVKSYACLNFVSAATVDGSPVLESSLFVI